MKIYFISGLAADRRVFKNICIPDGFEAVYLDWLPSYKNETLETYALRMSHSINASEPFVLVGLSFGGMLATEIAKKTSPVKTIIISSIPSAGQLPGYYQFAATLKLYKVVPIGLIKSAVVLKRLFTTESREDKEILLQMTKDIDPHFIRWALGAILYWKNSEVPATVYHIHGERDRLLPLRYTKPSHVISKAGHLMVVNRAGEISRIMKEILCPN
jgi:pimeloyl-ACP methyl ester carboxylesterase